MKTWESMAVALVVAAAAFGVTGPAAATVVPVVIARYSFDTAKSAVTVADESGHGHALIESAGHGGKVTLERRPAGHAAEFPAKCAGKKCPHAVLQAPDAPELNPGTAPIRYGAAIELDRKQTGSGQNVVQKGFSASGSQYKLQVDGAAGRPSCVLSDGVAPGIHVARSDVSVSDGKWHQLECRRDGAALTLLVDGAVHATTAIPATLSVLNTAPLSIGGKGDGADNDQFHGALDDVWIALG
jgi:hypothetical protein